MQRKLDTIYFEDEDLNSPNKAPTTMQKLAKAVSKTNESPE